MSNARARGRSSAIWRAVHRAAIAILSAASVIAIGAGCGSARHVASTQRVTSSTPTTAAPAPPKPLSGAINLTFSDTATATACPPNTPAGEDCFRLTASTAMPGHGTIGLGPTLDIEAPSTSRQCGAITTFTTRLTTTQGLIVVKERGPRLCLSTLETVKRDFLITGGSGSYVHAAGAGTVTMTTLTVGATEIWAGHINLKAG